VWLDEGVSIELARLSWYNFLRILWRHEGNMVLYYAMLRAWLPFGSSEAWIRTLSVLPAVATVPAVYMLGRRLFNTRVGLVAAFLLAVNAYEVRYAQEARSYSLYPFLCVLSSLYFVRFLQEPSRRNRIGHVLTSALSVYAHFFAGLLIVAQWLSVRMAEQPELRVQTRKNWKQFAISISPLVLYIVTTGTGVLKWIPRPGLTDLRNTAFFLTGNGGIWLTLAYGLACVPAVIFAVRERKLQVSWDAWRFRFLLLWLLFPVAFIFVISQLKPFYLIRYFVFVVPALVLLAASGLERLRSRWLLGAALVVFGVLSLRGVSSFYQQDFDITREDWRSATTFLLAHAQSGDAVLFHQPIGRMPYEYYRSRISTSNSPIVIYPRSGDGLTYRDFYAGHAKDAFLESVPAQYSRLWVVLIYTQTASGPDPTTRFLNDWFAKQYTRLQVENFPGIELRLYERTGPTSNGGSVPSR
jgi:mannosyltransferase